MQASSLPDRFYHLSVALTGFNIVHLYGTGQGETFFNTLRDILGTKLVEELTNTFQQLQNQAKGNETLLDQLVQKELISHPKWGPVCRNIIKMWYTGNWYALPASWQENYVSSSLDVTKVISAEAYVEGLVWKAMGRHPKSAKQPGYGTWALPPNFLK